MATTTKSNSKPVRAVSEDNTQTNAATEGQSTKKIVAREIDPHTLVSVRNGFQGTLVYISKRTGEQYIWESFGDEQEMELQELKNAKTSSKRFFTDNWFMFDDDWVIDYLGVRSLYRYALDLESFDDLFAESPEKISETIKNLSDGQKNSIAYRARQLIAEGEIDSMKAIAALETALGVELTEH